MAGSASSTASAKTDIWTLDPAAALAASASTNAGLTSAEAAKRLATYGPNTLQTTRKTDALTQLAGQFTSPIVIILVFATIVSGVLGDVTDALIILAIIGLSGALGFWQERGATKAVDALLEVVQVKSEVVRDGSQTEVSLVDIVPGDVVVLNAGDVIPGDCLVLESRSLLVDEAALTGETYPGEKTVGTTASTAPIAQRANALFLGTHVVSGTGRALVVDTGRNTQFGKVSARLVQRSPQTGFERGMTQFGLLLVRVMVVLVVAIFVINVILARPLIDSALFSLALAVGLTPQLLPAIVTISLSQGARLMARERVIVKRLEAIEDFGAMSILCTDKTGTMTVGSVELEGALGIDGKPSPAVRRLALLNAKFQTGFANPIDQAIVDGVTDEDLSHARSLDELSYDFTRKRLSILVDDGGKTQIVTKGALAPVLDVCSQAQGSDGQIVSIDALRQQINAQFESLSAGGYRVLGIASRDAPGKTSLVASDESDLVFRGLVTFLDPPKESAKATIADLNAAGISVRMITGDNRLVAAHIGAVVGLDPTGAMTGADVKAHDRLGAPGEGRVHAGVRGDRADRQGAHHPRAPSHGRRRRLHGRRHQRRSRPACRRRWHQRRQCRRRGQGGGRDRAPRQGPARAARWRAPGPQNVRQHDEVRLHDDQRELRQRPVDGDRGGRPAVPAAARGSDPADQLPDRFSGHDHCHGRGRSRAAR